MIVKEREIPLRLRKLESLGRCLHRSHPARQPILEEYKRRKSGYRGELAFDRYLDTYLSEDYYVLRNLRLPVRDSFFQIDTLILSPAFLLIAEIKNHSGSITLDSKFNQMTHTFQENETVIFNDPLLQAKLQASLLDDWLENHAKLSIPIDYLVVFTNPSVHIDTPTPAYYYKVCRMNSFLEKLASVKKHFPKPIVTPKELKRLAKLLTKNHNPEDNINILEDFNLTRADIHTGVQCPACSNFTVKRVSGYWRCSSCLKKSREAHIQAIDDYFLLIDCSISNRTLCDILCLSPSTARRLITTLHLHAVGSYRGRHYTK
ncbi:NERD domain-containing protein [Bacillus massilinigeriensis]|uniref:NERD domain-containing protein n=1 Tax=Bacillus mediterraneensis TaxID=1805474 RepID=UPI0008F97545|nr:NERD domain-containing protein [Bacillus mediterraneensis]